MPSPLRLLSMGAALALAVGCSATSSGLPDAGPTPCVDPSCVGATRIADASSSISALLVDDTSVYFLARTSPDAVGTLFSAPVSGGSATRLADVPPQTLGVAQDTTNLYYGTSGAGGPFILPKSGGTATAINDWGQSAEVSNLRVAGGFLYYRLVVGTACDQIQRVALPGTTGSGGEILYCDGPIFEVDPPNAYYVASYTSQLYSVSATPSQTQYPNPSHALADVGQFPRSMATYGGALFLAVATGGVGGGQLLLVPEAGGAPAPLASGLYRPGSLVADSTGVYYCEEAGDGYGLQRLRYDGAAPQRLAPGCGVVALGGDFVYFTSGSSVWRLPKNASGPSVGTGAGQPVSFTGCSVTACPSTVTCSGPRFQSTGGSLTWSSCCREVDDPGIGPGAACGTLLSDGTCGSISGYSPTDPAPDTVTCTASSGIRCDWPSGSVTCPIAWEVASSGPSGPPTVYMEGCCAQMESGVGANTAPQCGHVYSAPRGTVCGKPAAGDNPVW